MIQDLTRALTNDLLRSAIETGDEFIFPYAEALKAIEVASVHDIAILGVEAFEVRKDDFKVLDYSGYEFPFTGDWKAFVEANNAEAMAFIEARQLGENHGYLLTSTSELEFITLPDRLK
ncbi:MAG: hypothetical protein ACRD18_04850 [Terriglobia bacterium]